MPTLLERIVARTGIAPSPNSKIANILWRKGVEKTDELQRILALPRRTLDLDTVPDLTPLFLHTPVCKVRGCDLCSKGPAKLFPLQSAILLEAERMRGALGPMPVGSGKTLISMLLVDALAAKRAVLMVPPAVRHQLLEVDIPRYGRHFRLPLDRLQVVSYSQLSIARTAGVLDEIGPDCIIADEAHSFRYRSTARTKRFLRYMRENPGTTFVPLSGTLTTKSVRDYGHLSELALRKGSPLPGGYKELEEWAAALDSAKEGQESMPPGALLALCTGEELDKIATKHITGTEGARAGFRRRFVETPGVVSTYQTELGASLTIRKRPVTVPPEVTNAIRQLERTWSIGDEEIDSAATMAAKAREMSCGFWYEWDWPGGKKDVEWVEARKQWNRAVRQLLVRSAKPGLDSPMLVANAAMRGHLPSIEREWLAWAEVKERPQPPTKPVWISKFLVEDTCVWIREVQRADGDERGIVWFSHTAFENALRESTICPVFGAGQSEALIDEAQGNQIVVACSVHAHSTGKNLQMFSKNLVVSCPANGTTWEQLLGRTHRPGQEADEVIADVFLHTNAVCGAWNGALASARYIEETQGSRQKLLFAQKIEIT